MSEENRIFNFNWYPGHIAKAEKQLKEKIKLVDLIIELADARIPFSSSHKDLAIWAGSKDIIKVFSKIDIADPKKKLDGILIDSKARTNISNLIQTIEIQAKPINEKYAKKGLVNRPFKVMVVGYPNVGKSSLINALAKKKKAKVENKPGVTRQQQWIDVQTRINIKLLDTPGIIPTKFNNDDQALKLALCACVSDKAFEITEVARRGLLLISSLYPDLLEKHYGIEELSLENIQAKTNLQSLELAATHFINDFRTQKFSKISLE